MIAHSPKQAQDWLWPMHDYDATTTTDTDMWPMSIQRAAELLDEMEPKLPTEEELRLEALEARQRRRQSFTRPPAHAHARQPKAHLTQRHRHRGRSR